MQESQPSRTFGRSRGIGRADSSAAGEDPATDAVAGGAASGDSSGLSLWWTSIGEAIAGRWSASGEHVEGFPEVAATVIAESPPPNERIALQALAWLAVAELPEQHNRGTGFGQPAITVYRGEGFILELLYWYDESVTIHDHRFSGAFSILEGQSLQNVYEFDDIEPLWPGIESGTLRCTKVETLNPGEVRLIPRGRGLIHSNFHFAFPTPTVSLVARTLVKGEAPPQYLYSHGGLAFYDMERSSETVKRLEGLGASCRISAATGADFLRRVLVDATPIDVVSYVVAATSYLGSSLYLDPFIAASSIGESDQARRLLHHYALELQTSFAGVTELSALEERNDRLLMSMVAAGTQWEMASDLIGSVIPGVSPRIGLCRMVSALVTNQAPGRPSRRTLSQRALSYVNAVASASDDPGPVTAPPDDVYAELITHRVFGSLFRFVLSGSDGPRGSSRDVSAHRVD